jgi:hypothetical protein
MSRLPLAAWESSLNRRTFLVASGLGLAGMRPAPAEGDDGPRAGGSAKSTILFFLCGGSSHIDMWDMKPEAPAEYRGEFNPIATSAPGVRLCEHLPLLARQAHHLAIVNSRRRHGQHQRPSRRVLLQPDRDAADPTFQTLGNNRTPMPDDWPYMGCVVARK